MPSLDVLLSNPLFFLFIAFTLWMLVDAVRREEWLWVIFILLFPMLNTILYFFLVYRNAAPLGPTRGFELPGAVERSRIKQLEAQIHHLDKAHHHLQLGDIYFQQGKLDRALASYHAAYERDAEDIDIRAHLGQCLLRLQRAADARPLLETVCAENPRHDYGHSLMALAEACTALGDTPAAIRAWQRVIEENAYPRARVQLAELHLAGGETAPARLALQEVVNDDLHAPAFQRKRDAVWVKRAKKLLKSLGE